MTEAIERGVRDRRQLGVRVGHRSRAGRSTSCPILVSGVSAGIEEIRVQEIFNYALYDAPDVVREVIGFGGPMDQTPMMLLDIALEMVWAPMVRILADALELELDEIAHPGRATPARAHHRGRRAWARSRRARRARSASRCRASSTAVRCS